MSKVTIDRSDFDKIHDFVEQAVKYLHQRDEMNASMHMAQNTRLSPLTSAAFATLERMNILSHEVHDSENSSEGGS